jgi:2-polyprenyl-6-methoxyphenol hydroxylase-like FAD-dependent oxidoreductase
VLETAFYTYWSDLPVQAQAREFRRDVEGNYRDAIDRVPEFAARLRAATREDRFHAGGVPNFFRTPDGPGWALVGDAGYSKDPITAQGISDAFRSAELCAAALDDAFADRRTFDVAMSDYQRRRDADSLPVYEFTTQLAPLEPPPPEMQQLFAAIAGNQPAMQDFVSLFAGTLSLRDFFDPGNLADVMARPGATAGASSL